MNIPFLPDKSYKLFVYLGIGLFIYAWISRYNKVIEFENKRIEFNVQIKTLINESKYLDRDLKQIDEKAERLSKKLAIENPLNISDSGYLFVRTYQGDKQVVALSDSISILLDNFNKKKNEIAKKEDQQDIKNYELTSLREAVNEVDNFSFALTYFAFFIFCVGLALWIRYEQFEERILKQNNIHKPTFSERCQSCGVLFNCMQRYGTDVSGEENYNFCLNCFKNGEFTNKELTLNKIKDRKKNELAEKNKSSRYIRRYLKMLTKLDRWN